MVGIDSGEIGPATMGHPGRGPRLEVARSAVSFSIFPRPAAASAPTPPLSDTGPGWP